MSVLLSVKLNHINIPGSPASSITYKNRGYSLTTADYQYVMENLGSDFSNDTEKLSIFRLESDDITGHLVHFCEMEKNVFDFRERQYIKRYAIREIDKEECDYLYEKFKEFLNKFYTANVDDFYNSVIGSVSNVSLVATNIVNIRDDLLRDSDKYMLADYPHNTEEDRQAWIEYRKDLRDLTKQEGYPDNFELIEFPISPNTTEQFSIMKQYIDMGSMLMDEIGPELMNSAVDNIVRNFSSVALKIEILNSLSKLKIPMFIDQDLTIDKISKMKSGLEEALSDGMDLYNDAEKETIDAWNDATTYLNYKISLINSKISEYNLGFTIQDLIDEIVEESKKYISAQELINEL